MHKFLDIKAVCFDAFGTLVEIKNKRSPYKAILKNATQGDSSTLFKRFMCEDLSFSDSINIALPDIDKTVRTKLLDDLKTEIESIELRNGISSIWAELRTAGIKIGVCSNLAQPYGKHLLNVLPDAPNVCVFSYEAGCMKPEMDIYKIVATSLGVEAGNILFTGDSQRNDVNAPREFGMQSISIFQLEKNFLEVPKV